MNEEILESYDQGVSDFRMAGFGPRWGAFLVDLNVLLIVVMILYRFIPVLNLTDLIPKEPSIGLLIGSGVLYLFGAPLISIIYRSIFESSKYQGTPGKIAVKIKVVNMSGGRITFIQALIRNFSRILSSLILYLGYFMVIWDNNKQAMHDSMAKTYVVMRD